MGAFSPGIRAKFRCTACGGLLVKRTSSLTHPHLRHDTYVCDNPICSACYSGITELTGIASPSGMPNARPVELPPTPAYPRNLALKVYQQAKSGPQCSLDLPEPEFDATTDR